MVIPGAIAAQVMQANAAITANHVQVIELVGVMATSVSTAGGATGSIHIA
jgi:hypothetical protein